MATADVQAPVQAPHPTRDVHDATAPAGKPHVVCNSITVQYTDMAMVLKSLGMEQAEWDAIMAKGGGKGGWPHSADQDGWKMAHDAIRRDMDHYLQGLAKTLELVEAGKPLEAWQVAALQLVQADFLHNVHHHHDDEELIFFPYMTARVVVPPKMSDDHKTLVAHLDKIAALVKALKPGPAADVRATVEELHSTYATMRAHMCQHLEEEELVGLPLLRKNFTSKEVSSGPEKKIVDKLKPSDMAWFLRPYGMQEKVEIMTRFGIPGMAQKLVLLPAVKKDDATVMHAYKELAKGEEIARPPKKGGCMCFGG